MPGASPNAIESALSLRIPWKLIRIVTFYVGLIGIWKLLAVADIWPSYVFPAPDLVWDTLWRNIDSGRIPDALTLSLKRMAIGYSLAMGIGLFLGAHDGRFQVGGRMPRDVAPGHPVAPQRSLVAARTDSGTTCAASRRTRRTL